MLCITRHEEMSYITIAGLDHVQVRTFSCTPQHKIALSWDLLAWIPGRNRIPCSFTNFITTPDLSGPFYIGTDIYHTQITEYSLGTILHNYSPWALFSLHRNFLIVILLDPIDLIWSWTGLLGSTFPVLFQLNWFFIYSDQFLRMSSYVPVIFPKNWGLIRWKLLLSGFKSVFVNVATDSSDWKSNLFFRRSEERV